VYEGVINEHSLELATKLKLLEVPALKAGYTLRQPDRHWKAVRVH
jgi:hypothetical protein